MIHIICIRENILYFYSYLSFLKIIRQPVEEHIIEKLNYKRRLFKYNWQSVLREIGVNSVEISMCAAW